MHPQLYITRRNHGLTQTEVAEILGITLVTYHKKESGTAGFTLIEAIKLAKHFNCTLDNLFMKEEVTQ